MVSGEVLWLVERCCVWPRLKATCFRVTHVYANANVCNTNIWIQ